MTYVDFAQIFGITLLVLSIGILFNLDNARQLAKELVDSAAGRMVAGILPLVFGSWVVVMTHGGVTMWAQVVTFIGWIMLLIGVFRIWFVGVWVRLIKNNLDKAPVLFSLFGLMLGLLLSYIGFLSS